MSKSIEEQTAFSLSRRSLYASSFALNKHNSDTLQGDGTRIGKYIDNDRDALIDGRRCGASTLATRDNDFMKGAADSVCDRPLRYYSRTSIRGCICGSYVSGTRAHYARIRKHVGRQT